jgi:hypothetical protein
MGLDTVIKRVHITPPPVHPSYQYIIAARGPNSRVVSAFNWRKKLVVFDKTQVRRFPGEYEVLTYYNSLNHLAESLYTRDGIPNSNAHQDALRIHHVRENIDFYLGHLLTIVPATQIRHVLMQENLDQDLARVFGYKNRVREKKNVQKMSNQLSNHAQLNLRRFLTNDYTCLTKLYCSNKISRSIMEEIL